MNITPINYQQNFNSSFRAKRDDYITKRFLHKVSEKKKAREAALKIKKAEQAAAAAAVTAIISANKILQSKDITYCKTKDNTINIGTRYNSGFYSLKSDKKMSDVEAMQYVAQGLTDSNLFSLGGLMNYMNMVKDIKRQDLIQKGLKIHTYELNDKISNEDMDLAAKILSNFTHYNIQRTDLFFIDEEAFYYDKITKTAYAINTHTANADIKSITRVCKFKTDDNGNAIGFTTKEWDLYKCDTTEKEYIEQQAPSVKLPGIIDAENTKDLAEGFRFGNSTIHDNYRVKIGMPKVLELLTQKGITGINDEQLTFTRFSVRNTEPQTRICYYDPTVGRSFVFKPEGEYMYQLVYEKDCDGNIISYGKY